MSHRARSLDQLVEFAAVQPDAATLRAVVDLDALAIAHHECDVGAGGAFYEVFLVRVHSSEVPKPKRLSRLVNRLKIETDNPTVASTWLDLHLGYPSVEGLTECGPPIGSQEAAFQER